MEQIEIALTGGNIRNSHIYLPRDTSLFPADAWGGSNKQTAGQPITVLFSGVPAAVQTDIDSKKAGFRSRTPIRQFFEANRLKENDIVMIRQTGPREFTVTPKTS